MKVETTMRRPVRARFLTLGTVALLIAACAGCPERPLLVVSPTSLDFGDASVRTSFAINNAGAGSMSWSVAETVWKGPATGWVLEDLPWLSIDPEDIEGVINGTQSRVFLDADREGMAAGTYNGGIRIVSAGGTYNVPVAITVRGGGGVDPGDGDVEVAPTEVSINGLDDTTTFTVTNNTDSLARWYTEVTLNESGGSAAEVQVAASPTEAATPAGSSTTVTVGIPDPDSFDNEHLNYKVTVKDKVTNAVIAGVIVSVDVIGGPAVGVDPALLDYGENGYQVSFFVANVGDPSSMLDFGVFQKIDDDSYIPYDTDADPLVAYIEATDGMDDVRGHPNNPWLYAREVSVTISRDGLEADLETRDLYVCAVRGLDGAGQPLIDPEIAPVHVGLRVKAAPYVEGALNRSRPPSLMRFVFTLRDKRGVATDAADALIRNKIKFYITEDKFPLDPDESSRFITGPEHLKCNYVVLLDFTGSMYQAGVDDPLNRLEPGEAIDQMVESAKQFILDLPASYRVAVMEYHDRQQPGRIIHGFDTNKQAVVAALDAFTLPEAEHGSSEIYEALYDATEALVREDPSDVLPFDDADIRAVFFVSDGWDTSSTKRMDEIIEFARNSHVRFYPLGYSGRLSNPVNGGKLIALAAETGGHAYYAPEMPDLARLLDTGKGLAFGRTDVNAQERQATLHIRNIAAAAYTWYATNNLTWLTLSPLAGSVPPVQRNAQGGITESGIRDIVASIPANTPPGDYEGSFTLTSDAGNATVAVRATVNDAGKISLWTVTPQTLDPGRVWQEMRGQVVLSYTSLFQEGNHTYYIEATYPDSKGESTSAGFEEDGVYYPGDPRAGQVSLSTAGINDGRAEVFLRTDYVPRNITQFTFRFVVDVPESLTPNLSFAQRQALRTRLQNAINNDAVTLAPGGLLSGWFIFKKPFGVYTILTDANNYLPLAAFGNLLQITLGDLGPNEAFRLGMRVDNGEYYSPASATGPSLTKYFLYPGGMLNPNGWLEVTSSSRSASPAESLAAFALPFDPEAANAWDRDEDLWPDFDDSAPDDPEAGDQDDDSYPDLEDAAPTDPNVH